MEFASQTSEVTGMAMGAFFCRRDAKGVERWWLEVTGKGNKTRLVPATDELIAELARYRRIHGLPPTPQPGEARPRSCCPSSVAKKPCRAARCT